MIVTQQPMRLAASAALVASLVIASQSAVTAQNREREEKNFGHLSAVYATLPVTAGWFNGMPCFYLSTEASDPDVAVAFKANYAPNLASAAPNATRTIYAVTNFAQGNIVPSVAVPAGPANADAGYSPLWLVTTVTRNTGATPSTLRSEADVLAMQAAGKVTLAKTNIVVNCSIMYTPQGGVLPGTNVAMTSGAKAGSTDLAAKLPVSVGWFNGQAVLYISPEASDAGAGGPNAHLSKMLGAAANSGAGADLYAVTNFKQGNIIPSAPVPAGPANSRREYVPLWQVNLVTWNAGATPRTLKSAADVQAALADGVATVLRTNIVVNCPVVYTPLGGTLAGVTFTTVK